MKITKLNDNEVEITKTTESVVDYETLIAQREGILLQQAEREATREQEDAESQDALRDIEEALGKGISAKPPINSN